MVFVLELLGFVECILTIDDTASCCGTILLLLYVGEESFGFSADIDGEHKNRANQLRIAPLRWIISLATTKIKATLAIVPTLEGCSCHEEDIRCDINALQGDGNAIVIALKVIDGITNL